MADPGFSQKGGSHSKGGCEKLIFGQFFPKNCMKLKEFGPEGARPWRYLRSANVSASVCLVPTVIEIVAEPPDRKR